MTKDDNRRRLVYISCFINSDTVPLYFIIISEASRICSVVLPYAEKIINLSHRGSEQLREMKREKNTQLSVADMTQAFASHIISEFLMEHPEIRLHRTYLLPEESQNADLEKTFDWNGAISN